MRLPNVRFTVRRMMVAVTVVASVGASWWGVSATRARADREVCRYNLRGISVALIAYATAHNFYPHGAVPSEVLPIGKRMSWLVSILNYLSAGGPNILDKARAWDDPAATVVVYFDKETGRDLPGGSDIEVYHCPAGGAAHVPAGHEPTEYVGVAGLGVDAPSLPLGHPRAGVFGYERATPVRQITDGLASTVAVVEAREGRGPWRAGGPSTVRGVDPSRRPYVGAGRQFGGSHRGGAQAAFADGSVRFLSESIDPKVFEVLSTIAGGEPLPAGWDQ